MGKKVTPRKKIIPTKRKKTFEKGTTVRHHLTVYFLSVVTGVLVFFVGSLFFSTSVPCANSKTCTLPLGEKIENNAVGMFGGHEVIPPKIDLAYDSQSPSVLGDSSPSGEKHIYVDLSTQKIYAYQGNNEIFQTFISSGKWNPTPVGNFSIWSKFRATRMAGGEGADAYDLPNVPYVMYFYGDYGLHGAYWHNNFGHPMSHGCVNLRIVDAKTLYEWAEIGTPVSVCNSFTGPNNCVQKNRVN